MLTTRNPEKRIKELLNIKLKVLKTYYIRFYYLKTYKDKNYGFKNLLDIF